MQRNDLKIEYSNGRGKGGKFIVFIRPARECSNRSRRVFGFTQSQLEDQIKKAIDKYYPQVIYYQVDGHTIGSCNERLALVEYWRICDIKDRGKIFDVTLPG